MLGKEHGQPLLFIRAIRLAVFFSLVASGNATITTLLFTEGLAIGIVVTLWVRAWQKAQPGGGLVLAAILLSMHAAILKASSTQFTLGRWEFDSNSIYHLAQMPGIFLLLTAIRASQTEQQRVPSLKMATWLPPPDLSYHCSCNRLSALWTNDAPLNLGSHGLPPLLGLPRCGQH